MASTNYLNNEDFIRLLIQFNQTSNKFVYSKIGKCFLLIAKNLLNSPRYINYTQNWKDEMLSNALYYMTKRIYSYDPTMSDKENPFNYFTTVAINAFEQTLTKQRKISDSFQSLDYIENMEEKVFRL